MPPSVFLLGSKQRRRPVWRAWENSWAEFQEAGWWESVWVVQEVCFQQGHLQWLGSRCISHLVPVPELFFPVTDN